MVTVPLNEYAKLSVYHVTPLLNTGESIPVFAVKELNVASVDAGDLVMVTV